MATSKKAAPVQGSAPAHDENMSLEDAIKAIHALRDRQDQLEKQLEKKDEELAAARLEINDLTKGQEGWLITVPSPLFEGKTMGVKFTNGIAFLPADATYPEKGGSVKGEKIVPGAEWMAKQLAQDFGYSIEFYSFDKMQELKKSLDKRQGEYEIAKQAQAVQQENMLKSGLPQRFGIS